MKLTQVVKIEGNYEVLDNLAKITNGPYNPALYESSQRYKKGQKFYFYYDLCNILKSNTPYALLPSQTAQAALQKVEGATKSFLKRRRNDANAGYPGYHKKNTAWVIPIKSQQIKIDGNILTVPMSTKYKEEKGLEYLDPKLPKLRYAVIVKYIELYKTDRWYASIVIDAKEQQESVPKGNLYIDLGVKKPATVFDGKKVAVYSGGKLLPDMVNGHAR